MDDGQRMDLRVYRERVSGVVRIQGSYLIGGAMSRYEIGKPKTKKKKKKKKKRRENGRKIEDANHFLPPSHHQTELPSGRPS